MENQLTVPYLYVVNLDIDHSKSVSVKRILLFADTYHCLLSEQWRSIENYWMLLFFDEKIGF